METLNKEKFMQQYVLNRASVVDGILKGLESAQEAEKVYNYIYEHRYYHNKDEDNEK